MLKFFGKGNLFRERVVRLALVVAFGLALSGNVHAQRVLNLEQALEVAFENSPRLKKTEISKEISAERLKAQKASLKTQFSLDLTPFTYSNQNQLNQSFSQYFTVENYQSDGSFRASQPIVFTGGTVSLVDRFRWTKNVSEQFNNNSTGAPGDAGSKPNINESYRNNVYLELNQPLFTYNKTRMELIQLEYEYERAEMNYYLSRMNVERDVTTSFYNLYTNQNNVEVKEEELKNQQASYDIIKNKVEAGLAAKEELYQAELNLLQTKQGLYNAQINLENTKDSFKQLLGISVYEDILILEKVQMSPVEIDPEFAIQKGLDQRFELRQLDIDMQNARFDLIQTKNQGDLNGQLSARFGLSGNDELLQDVYSNPVRDQLYSVSLSVPIWDWGARKARVKASQLQIKNKEIDISDQRINIQINVRKALRQLDNLLRQVEIDQQNLKNAELTYEINLERYKNGDLTSIDLNRYQKQLSDAKTNITKTLIDYKVELLNVKLLTLWDFEKNASSIPQNMAEKKELKGLRGMY
ncbi:membrane protein [Fulvitalea axinellae]|uniref:Membrane protein n=1 Tax=Fulvitalea axinellae TaxID=1182444 RepID=A0AAU9D3W6_9BACT|nr:membrane protein [Fulvitalea axinellae]